MKTRSRVRTARVVTFQPVVFFGLVIVLLLGLPLVTAAQTPSLNWGSEVNPSRCRNDQGYRYLELNVTRHVEGDVALTDALATPGTVWAVRDFNQHIQVWNIGILGGGGSERFCALVRYQGSFATLGGQVDGTFEGGYRLVFFADEGTNPNTRGQIGTFPGPVDLFDWLGTSFSYFVNVDSDLRSDLEWWGWIYHGGKNGTWVNAITGNQGGITH